MDPYVYYTVTAQSIALCSHGLERSIRYIASLRHSDRDNGALGIRPCFSRNGEYISISEATAARIRKVNVKTMSMEEESLIDNLPVPRALECH